MATQEGLQPGDDTEEPGSSTKAAGGKANNIKGKKSSAAGSKPTHHAARLPQPLLAQVRLTVRQRWALLYEPPPGCSEKKHWFCRTACAQVRVAHRFQSPQAG